MGTQNRTGIAVAAGAREMIEASQQATPTPGDGEELREIERRYAEEAPSLGTAPSDGDPAAGGLDVLLDRMGERLAFERTGTRLYEGLMRKLEAQGSFPGGPEMEELEEFRDHEAQHFGLLQRAIEELGGDPTAVTPSADLAGVESMGIGVVIADPRTTLPQALHAILGAELVDNEGWELLVRLCRDSGHTELAKGFEQALADEERHLETVRDWVEAHVLEEA